MPPRPFAARLAAFSIAALLLAAMPALAAEFTDSAGRIVMLPDQIHRVMVADMSAEVLVFVLAPDKLAGWVQPPMGALPRKLAQRPLLGPIADPAATAAITRVKPDVIVDVGEVTPDRAAFADQVSQATGTPYILLDGSFNRTPTMLRVTGRLLGVADRADDLAGSAEHAINALRGQLLIEPAVKRPHVYYGLGGSGLEPALPGSPAAAAIDDAGAINVAAGVPPAPGTVLVTRQQIHEWNPDIIIAESPAFYKALLHDPGWRTLAAVRSRHVYLEPSAPFGWIDNPPGVNRLIGLYWLSVLFYPGENQNDVRSLAQDFYDKFYGIKLSDQQIDGIARTAGIPASDAPHLADLSLSGTGTSPANTPPGRAGAPLPPVTTTPSYLMPK
jgi:iron complex transport system substrate-binding protein